jgi:Rod binding domain-containing protein
MRLNLNIPLPLSEANVRARIQAGSFTDKARRAQAAGEMGSGKAGSEKDGEAARLDQVMHEFESLLVEQMLKEMRNNVPESPLFGQSRGREIFNEMLDGEYAKAMEQRGGLGLARFMIDKMDRG